MEMKETTKPDDLAFPLIEGQSVAIGLIKREYFAAKMMQALLSDVEVGRWLQTDPRYNNTNFKEVVAINAVEFADALINELNKEKKENV